MNSKYKIGNVELKNNFILSPMAGVNNYAFRKMCIDNGCGLVVSEMVSDKGLEYNNSRTLSMLKNYDEQYLSIQIFGSEVETLVNAAKYIDKNTNAKFIDINMGCPVNKVAKKSNAGASLLKDENKVYEIIKNVVENVSKPVTVKIRIGWDNDSINAVSIAKIAQKAGASAICVHGRTRNQMYTGTVNYDVIKDVCNAVSIPVIGNGDIVDIKSAKKMFDTGCKFVSIARGALGNPFIFKELDEYFNKGRIIPKPTNKDIYDNIKKHYTLLKEIKSEKVALLEMRSHIAYYLKGIQGSSKIKQMIFKLDNEEDIFLVLKYFLIENKVIN